MSRLYRRTVGTKKIYYAKLVIDGKERSMSLRTGDRNEAMWRLRQKEQELGISAPLTQAGVNDFEATHGPASVEVAAWGSTAPTAPTVNALHYKTAWKIYEAWARLRKRPKTLTIERFFWFQFFHDAARINNVYSITPARVREYQEWHLSRGNKACTANNALRQIGTVINRLKRLDAYGGSNPFLTDSVERLPQPQRRPKFVSKETVQALLAASECVSDDIYLAFALGLYTGFRHGELLALRWKHVDWERTSQDGEVLGCIQVISEDGFYAKTDTSNRVMPLHPALRAILVYKRPENATEDDFIIKPKKKRIKGAGRRWDWRKQWGQVVKACDIIWFTPHHMRDTFASLLVQSGESIYIVRDLLGHRSVAVTEIYAHLRPMTSAIKSL
ncbi:MAG: site-specific integrase [Candidatus Hydrogenedentes bacterium]|nr:site-specific integrase [Candidatus Hydrogenedentota bacterium]